MDYLKTFRGPRGPLVLGEGVSRETVSVACREAALAFMAGVGAGWDKLALVGWLTGPYAAATAHVSRGERVAGLDPDRVLDAEVLEQLMTRVRLQLLASLERATLDAGVIDFAEEALARGFVRCAEDVDGCDVWVPVDQTRMRLRDRLRSLFAADYLDDPSAYLELHVCPRCEAVVFDERARRAGHCGAPERASRAVPRADVAGPTAATKAAPKAAGEA